MSIAQDIGQIGAAPGLLDRERIIAKAGFNRWLVPPAALCIHLCIGMAYGFSVFWLPLSQAIGITKPVACAADVGLSLASLFTTTCDWKVADLGWMYTLFFVLLGSSAAIWGGWLERVGPAQGRLRLGDVLVRRSAARRSASTPTSSGCCGSAPA
jgi:hypothetical protein